MTRREIAILGCKLLGLFIFIKYIPSFFGFIPILYSIPVGQTPEAGGLASIAFQLIPWGALIFFGAGLWFWAKRISQWIVPEETLPVSFELDKDFVTAALSFIGLVLLVVSIPVLLHQFVTYSLEIIIASTTHSPLTRDVIRAIFQFFLGIIILSNSSSFSRLIQRASKSTFHATEQKSITSQMTRRDMAHLGCRLLAIYLIVIYSITLISHLGMLATINWQQNTFTPMMLALQIVAALYFFFLLILGLWLWFGANLFATKIAGGDFSANPVGFNLNILPLLISFFGLWILATAVPGLLNNLSMYYIRVHYAAADIFFLSTIFISGAKVLLGLLLFFASPSITQKLQGMQSISCSFKHWLKNPSGSGVNR